MIEERPPRAAPHTPSDDPRVDILAEGLCSTPGGWRGASETGKRIAREAARGLLARLDAAAPAREDALARWLDTEIADSERIEAEALDEGDQWLADGHDQRARTLREVRDRLGATTNTMPEEDA